MFVKQSQQDPGETVHIDWSQPFKLNTEKKSSFFLFFLALGVSTIFDSDIAGHVLSGQHPSHFTKSAVVVVLYFLLEVYAYDCCPIITRNSVGQNGGYYVRIENHGIPREKGIGGSAALCSSIAASIIACRYSYETPSEEVLLSFWRIV